MTKHNPPEHTASEPVIRISYQSSLGESRGAVFETYMPQSASVADMTLIMDKLCAVCDIQTYTSKIEELERAIISDKKHLEAGKADMERIAEHQLNVWATSGKKGEFRLTQAEAQARQNVEGSLVNRQKAIELMEAQLAELKVKLSAAIG